jgi:hypothetical protein
MVGILLHCTSHATGVVRDHASDRASMRAGRIRSQPVAVLCQQRVDVAEYHPGACSHAQAPILHFAAIPVTAHIDQNIVGLGLAVETRARRPKRRVSPGLTAIPEYLYDVIGCTRQHNNPGDEPIRARIRGIAYEIDCPVQNVLLSQEGDEIDLQVGRCSIDHGAGYSITLRGAVEPPYARGIGGKQLSDQRSAFLPIVEGRQLAPAPLPPISPDWGIKPAARRKVASHCCCLQHREG